MGAYVPESGERWSSGGAGTWCTKQYMTGASVFDEAKSALTFSYVVYPNYCRDILPPEGS
jgi:hypothetical protein